MKTYVSYACVLIVLSGLAIWARSKASHEIDVNAPLAEVVKLLGDRALCPAALARLLVGNDVTGLPDDFHLSGSSVNFGFFEATNRSDESFRMIRVGHYSTSGERYTFIFDDDGKCVLVSPDSETSRIGGLGDFTGDGEVEKLLETDLGVVEVWRLARGSSEILMDLRENTSEAPLLFMDVWDPGAGKPFVIVLSAYEQSLGRISWSAAEGSFVGEDLDDRFTLRSPLPPFPTRCPAHPENEISVTKKCPTCGNSAHDIIFP